MLDEAAATAAGTLSFWTERNWYFIWSNALYYLAVVPNCLLGTTTGYLQLLLFDWPRWNVRRFIHLLEFSCWYNYNFGDQCWKRCTANVTVSDPLVTIVGGPIATLAVGAADSTTFTAVCTVTQADRCWIRVRTTAAAARHPPSGPNVTDTSSDPTLCTTCDPVPNLLPNVLQLLHLRAPSIQLMVRT
jgi:hypothetical protein